MLRKQFLVEFIYHVAASSIRILLQKAHQNSRPGTTFVYFGFMAIFLSACTYWYCTRTEQLNNVFFEGAFQEVSNVWMLATGVFTLELGMSIFIEHFDVSDYFLSVLVLQCTHYLFISNYARKRWHDRTYSNSILCKYFNEELLSTSERLLSVTGTS